MATTLKVKMLNPDASLPSYAHPGDAGLDLYASETVRLGPGESRAFEAIVLESHLPEGAGRILLEIGDSEIVVEQAEPLSVTSPATGPVENQVEEESDLLP